MTLREVQVALNAIMKFRAEFIGTLTAGTVKAVNVGAWGKQRDINKFANNMMDFADKKKTDKEVITNDSLGEFFDSRFGRLKNGK